MSRQGSAHLRRVPVEAAWWVIRRTDGLWTVSLAAWVPRLGKRRAMVAISHQRLVTAWRVWRGGRLAREVNRA